MFKIIEPVRADLLSPAVAVLFVGSFAKLGVRSWSARDATTYVHFHSRGCESECSAE